MALRRKIAGAFGAAIAAVGLTVTLGGVAHADTPYGDIWHDADISHAKCLDVRKQDDYNHANARVQQWDCSGALEQQWSAHAYGLTPPAGEFGIQRTLYQLKNLRSGMCMEVRGDAVAGGQIDQYPCGSGSTDDMAGQLWLVDEAYPPDPFARFVLSNWAAMRFEIHLCLDVQGDSSSNGAKVQLYYCNGTHAQQFNGPLIRS